MAMVDMRNIRAGKRREKILEMLNREGKVTVSHLTTAFHVSDVSIRVDLSEMEREGLLCRVRGGAVSTKKAYYETSLNERMSICKEEKTLIAKTCAAVNFSFNAPTSPVVSSSVSVSHLFSAIMSASCSCFSNK